MSLSHDSNPHHSQSYEPEREITGEFDTLEGPFALSQRQQTALPIIALSPTVSQAARDSGVSESTIYRWMEQPAFRHELEQMRRSATELAWSNLMAALPRAVEVLTELLEHPDDSIRLRAAKEVLAFVFRTGDLRKLQSDLQELRDTLLPMDDRPSTS